MADSDDRDDDDAPEAAAVDQAAERFEIEQVIRIKSTRGNVQWYPSTQVEDGAVYVRLAKWDPVLTRLVTGKGMNRHKAHGEGNTLNVTWWHEAARLRILAICTYGHSFGMGWLLHSFNLHSMKIECCFTRA